MLENRIMIVHYYNGSISVKDSNQKFYLDISSENFNDLLVHYRKNFTEVCGMEQIKNPLNDGYAFNFSYSYKKDNDDFSNFKMIMDKMVNSMIIIKHNLLPKELQDEYTWINLNECTLDKFATEFWKGIIVLAYRQIFFEKELNELRNKLKLAQVDQTITINDYLNFLKKSIDFYDYDIMERLVNYTGKYQDINGDKSHKKLSKKLYYDELKNHNQIYELIEESTIILKNRDTIMKKTIDDYYKLSINLMEEYVKQEDALPEYIYDYASRISEFDEEKWKLYKICIEKGYAYALDDFYFDWLLSGFEHLNVRKYLYRNMTNLKLNRIENCFNKKFLFIYSVLELEFNKEIDYIRTFKNLEYVFDNNVKVIKTYGYKDIYKFLLSQEEIAILTIFLYRLLDLDCIKKLNLKFKEKHLKKYEKSLKQEISDYPALEYLRLIDKYLPLSTSIDFNFNSEISIKDAMKQTLNFHIDNLKEEDLNEMIIKCEMLGIDMSKVKEFHKAKRITNN